MSRNPTPAPVSKAAPLQAAALAEDISTTNALAIATLERNERVTALATQINYQGSTDHGVLVNSAKDSLRRLGMVVFELGAYLLLLKEGCEHGDFMLALEEVGISHPSAKKYMAMTRRFANGSTSIHLEKLGFSKMAELLPLDNDQVDDLVGEGQTGELALDDVARMSVKQLRQAVHKERAEAAKQKNQVERLTTVNTELHEEARLIKRLPPAEELKRLQREAADVQFETMGTVRGVFRQALVKLSECGQDQSLVMAGMVGQVMAELANLQGEFGLVEIGGTPEWERWAQAQQVDKAPAVN